MWAATKPPFILPLSTTPRPSRGFTRRHSVTAAINPTNSDSNARYPSEEISGSDVLWALQRVAAAKKKSQGRAKRKTTKKTSDVEGTKEEEEEPASSREVRPIRIDSEWGPRLDDLEDRLRQLARLM